MASDPVVSLSGVRRDGARETSKLEKAPPSKGVIAHRLWPCAGERDADVETAVSLRCVDDLFVDVRDFVGGRSRTIQNALREAKLVCLSDLREEAARLGADAVVGIQLAYAPVRAGLTMLVVTGTAVGLGPPRLR